MLKSRSRKENSAGHSTCSQYIDCYSPDFWPSVRFTVFFPAAPFFLFMHGKDVTIPKGTEITAYTNGEIKLDPAKFVPAEATASRSTPQAAPALGPKLTDTDILKLKGAGLSDDLIIAKIKASEADYNLGVDDLLELKKANVSDGIIAAMLEATKR